MKPSVAAIAVIVAASVAACGSSQPDTPTDAGTDAAPDAAFERLADMIATIEVTTNGGNSLSVDADFDGPLLPADAAISASFRGETRSVGRSSSGTGELFNDFGSGVWTLTSPVVADESLTLTITTTGQVATATVTTPDPFVIGSVTGLCGTASDPMVVTWAPTSTDPMWWDAFTGSNMGNPCTLIIPADRSIPDTGRVEIPYCLIGSGPMCLTGRSLMRFRNGTVVGLATGSTIRAEQPRSF